MMVRYEKFLPEVVPYVHDVADMVAVSAIRSACIDFCEKSLYWVYTLDPITAEAGVGEYDLEAYIPSDTLVARVLDAWFDNLPMTPSGADQLRRIFPMDWREMEGRPQYFTSQYPCTMIVAPKPTIQVGDGFKIIAALRPTRDSLTVSEDIYERWLPVIGYGARARLYDTPNAPYFDTAQAGKYRVMFEAGISQAKADRSRGLTRSVSRVRPPRLV